MLDCARSIAEGRFPAQLLQLLLCEDRRDRPMLSGGSRMDACCNELRERDKGPRQEGDGKNRFNKREAARHVGRGCTADPRSICSIFRRIVTTKPSTVAESAIAEGFPRRGTCYWVGLRICLNVSVLTSRNIGVPAAAATA